MTTPRNWHHSTKDYASCSEKNKQLHIAHRKTSSPPWTLLSNCHCQEDATSTLTHHSHNLLNQKSTCKALQLSSRTLTKTTTTLKQQSYYHMKQLSRNRKLPCSNDTHYPLTKSLVKQSLAKTLASICRFSRNYASS